MGRKYFKVFGETSFLKENSGMTLSEIIVVVAILGLLIVLAAMTINPKLQLGRARDSRRKADLQRIAISLEDFAGDKTCYPTAIYNGATDCVASTEINPYLKNVPCDPSTDAQYYYVRPTCKEFAVYASLEIDKTKNYGDYNYVIASPNLSAIPTVSLPTGGPAAITSIPIISEEPTLRYACRNGDCFQESGYECSIYFHHTTLCDLSNDCTNDCCCSVGGGTTECANPQNECIK